MLLSIFFRWQLQKRNPQKYLYFGIEIWGLEGSSPPALYLHDFSVGDCLFSTGMLICNFSCPGYKCCLFDQVLIIRVTASVTA